jgi:hypothetical protein
LIDSATNDARVVDFLLPVGPLTRTRPFTIWHRSLRFGCKLVVSIVGMIEDINRIASHTPRDVSKMLNRQRTPSTAACENVTRFSRTEAMTILVRQDNTEWSCWLMSEPFFLQPSRGFGLKHLGYAPTSFSIYSPL